MNSKTLKSIFVGGSVGLVVSLFAFSAFLAPFSVKADSFGGGTFTSDEPPVLMPYSPGSYHDNQYSVQAEDGGTYFPTFGLEMSELSVDFIPRTYPNQTDSDYTTSSIYAIYANNGTEYGLTSNYLPSYYLCPYDQSSLLPSASNYYSGFGYFGFWQVFGNGSSDGNNYPLLTSNTDKHVTYRRFNIPSSAEGTSGWFGLSFPLADGLSETVKSSSLYVTFGLSPFSLSSTSTRCYVHGSSSYLSSCNKLYSFPSSSPSSKPSFSTNFGYHPTVFMTLPLSVDSVSASGVCTAHVSSWGFSLDIMAAYFSSINALEVLNGDPAVEFGAYGDYFNWFSTSLSDAGFSSKSSRAAMPFWPVRFVFFADSITVGTPAKPNGTISTSALAVKGASDLVSTDDQYYFISSLDSSDPGPGGDDDGSYDQGYQDGYVNGLNKGQSDKLTSPVEMVLNPVQSFLNMPLFGTISIGAFVSVALFVAIAIIFLKMFSGG